MATNYTKMTVYKLKEVLNSQYNRTDEKRHHRSVLFLIENTIEYRNIEIPFKIFVSKSYT